ncbi:MULTISPECIES: DUF192 domain-containing protein [Halolamina]|uniref:ACR n=1 Tax=Halolamina pelagica TaxID=699431 RepID=A0A1I5RLN6_9EURY|nr:MULTISPECIES: DUF192 domain-containing protein [Halolamina]NHX35225.1 DUF192 domain-containing protein [Halolamina sp. R1-12]SFP58826.1 hypothetical protein SAMN05216277_10516 [Halolamina pelagica]
MRNRAWLALLLALVAVAGGAVLLFGDAAERTTVTFVDGENGTELATVEVNVSDSYDERYTGLSDHESLGADEGMLFVHPREATHGYVMRDMAFPIDMVFVAENGTVTTIHHAELPPEGEDSPTYEGYGKYVVELPYEYTTEHGIEVGDRVEIPEEHRKTEV